MGFAQQYYVTADQLDQVDEDSRAQVLSRAVLLDEDQIAAYGDLLQPIPDDGLTNCTQDTYAEDCTDCRAEAVENFTATRTGFTAETDYDTDRLVFFSVPYDDGFTAAINGEPAKIEKVDNGLMALRVPGGADRRHLHLPHPRPAHRHHHQPGRAGGVWGLFGGAENL